MGTEVYPFKDMQVVDYGDIPCNPFNIPKASNRPVTQQHNNGKNNKNRSGIIVSISVHGRA